MMDDLPPDTVNLVRESWDRIKTSCPTWQDDLGDKLFDHLFLKKSPLSFKLLFPFGTAAKLQDEPAYKQAASAAASLLDFAVSQLECELDGVFGQLLELGLEHSNFPRLSPNHFAHVRKCLLTTLEASDKGMDAKSLAAWKLTITSILDEMQVVIKPMRRRSWDNPGGTGSSASGSIGSSQSGEHSSNPHIADYSSAASSGSGSQR